MTVSRFLAGGPSRTFMSWDPGRVADLGNEVMMCFRPTDTGGPRAAQGRGCPAGWLCGQLPRREESAVGLDQGLTSL